ncbi:FkbM family methyltransferase [Candidatus Halobonum tyrrellensis]|uniref:FkbM family methyltransferase n=1 Tax=Candidatus Halobonum tyrrellensis G22 TaxID=1324957 RepID=V4HMS0_9EURY|nr:FkbM family methyltransferase [Candidatus Halobonum tyrrellensis]ESP89224.1 FkbM family methyltransferase [Candidatus Halobonum tyrrellensis G22]
MSVTRESSVGEKYRRSVEVFDGEGLSGLAARANKYLYHNYYRPVQTRLTVRQGTMELDVNGVRGRFDVSSAAKANAVLYARGNERRLLADLLGELEPDDTVVDVGANIGIVSCLAAEAVTDGRVAAVEPFGPNVAALHRNLELNDAAVTVVESVLSDEPGLVEFASPVDEVCGVAAIDPADSCDAQVRAERGDELVRRGDLPAPSVVKIDVEGAEPLVIDGLERTLGDDDCRLVYCEVHHDSSNRPSSDDFGASYDAVVGRLESLGFDVSVLVERETETHLKAERPVR